MGGAGFDGDVSLARLPKGQLLVSGFYEGAPDFGNGAPLGVGEDDGPRAFSQQRGAKGQKRQT